MKALATATNRSIYGPPTREFISLDALEAFRILVVIRKREIARRVWTGSVTGERERCTARQLLVPYRC